MKDYPDSYADWDYPTLRIRKIILHVFRMELAENPDRVFELYLLHLFSPARGRFSIWPQNEHASDTEIGCVFSPAWREMAALEYLDEKGILGLSRQDQRKLMAKKILDCLTITHGLGTPGADVVRRHFTPTAAFFAPYTRPYLLEMLQEHPEAQYLDSTNGMRRAAIVAALVDLAETNPHWLPIGF